MDARQELLADARDGNVGDLDLLFANQREQEIERPRELIQLDDERRVVDEVRVSRHGRLRHGLGGDGAHPNSPARNWLGTMYGKTGCMSNEKLTYAGFIQTLSKPTPKYNSAIRIMMPYCPIF